MTLRDQIAVGMSLPHRSPDPLALTTIGAVARRAEELGSLPDAGRAAGPPGHMVQRHPYAFGKTA